MVYSVIMDDIKKQLQGLFKELNSRINILNTERSASGSATIPKAEIIILGQISLLVNEKVSAVLTLALTGDLDALLRTEHVVKEELKLILKKQKLIYDEDSHLIWIPPGSSFDPLFDFSNLTVKCIDPESALVSKAIKAVKKNKVLIREAIASGVFPKLVDRILENGGKLESFL